MLFPDSLLFALVLAFAILLTNAAPTDQDGSQDVPSAPHHHHHSHHRHKICGKSLIAFVEKHCGRFECANADNVLLAACNKGVTSEYVQAQCCPNVTSESKSSGSQASNAATLAEKFRRLKCRRHLNSFILHTCNGVCVLQDGFERSLNCDTQMSEADLKKACCPDKL